MSRDQERTPSSRPVTPIQLVGGATAAAAATYAASSSGLAGTVAGAALASVVGTLVAASCTTSLTRSKHALRRVAGREVEVESPGRAIGLVGLAMAAALIGGVLAMSAGLNSSTLLQRATDLGSTLREQVAASTDMPSRPAQEQAVPPPVQTPSVAPTPATAHEAGTDDEGAPVGESGGTSDQTTTPTTTPATSPEQGASDGPDKGDPTTDPTAGPTAP